MNFWIALHELADLRSHHQLSLLVVWTAFIAQWWSTSLVFG